MKQGEKIKKTEDAIKKTNTGMKMTKKEQGKKILKNKKFHQSAVRAVVAKHRHQKTIIESVMEVPAIVIERALNETRHVATVVGDKRSVKRAEEYWHLLGPGLTTGAADDDPSGIATYSQAGAQYGFQWLWLASFTFPLMAVTQEMCARIGMVTGRGLAANIRRHFPRPVLYIATILLFLANTFNIGADLGAMAEVTKLLFPRADFSFLVVSFALVILMFQIFTTYQRYSKYLKFLAMTLISYVVTMLLVKFDWWQVVKATAIPQFNFTKEGILLITGVLGTTISPYLFFWQTSQEIEEEIMDGKTSIKSRLGASQKEISDMRVDVWSGMFLSNLVMFAIIAVCGATLYANGITNIETAAQAAAALKPLAGDFAYILFALGIISTGLLAIPVLAGSISYALSESFEWEEGLYKQLGKAKAFYGVIVVSMIFGLMLNFIGLDPIKALVYSAVANGVVAPVVLVLIVMLASDKKIMGEWVNGKAAKIFGWAVTMLMLVAGLATIWSIIA
ncbi:MAG: Nramp family divalent metal transporter [bacterium]